MGYDAKYRIILHRMGYYAYQQGLIYRHLNQEGGWNSHLKNCRNFILKAADYYKPSVITVLGSGWLLDIPLKELAERTSQINLVDVVHPPEVKAQVSGMKNVFLREEDVSGGLIREVWQKAGHRFFFNKLHSIDEIKIREYQPGYKPGLVISLNILTQLESMPLKLLLKKADVSGEVLLNFRKEIQNKHISFLTKHKSVLITDTSEVVTENSGEVNEVKSVLADLPAGKEASEWTWDFDLRMSDYYNKRSVFKVSAILF